jgi:putative salt-induced outer membrane protein YdiY
MARLTINLRATLAAALLILPSCVGTDPPQHGIDKTTAGPALQDPAAAAPQEPPGTAPPEPPTTATPQGARPFVPPPPPRNDNSDGLRLTSGEWLRGELISMRHEELAIDSDKLDEQTFDWEDVAEVRTARSFSALFVDGHVVEGPLHIIGNQVSIGAATPTPLRRVDLEAFVHTSVREADRWSGKLSLGITQRSGNTDQTDITAYGLLRRETPWTLFETTYNGAYSRIRTQSGTSEEVTNNHRLSSRLDWYLEKRLYVTGGADLFRDPFQNIDYRSTPYLALGYDIVDQKKVSWSLSAGPAYQRTRFDSVTPPQEVTDDTFAAVFQSRFEWDISKDVEFDFDYNIPVPLPESQEYTHPLSAILSIDITSDLDLDLSWVWDRVNQPATDVNGLMPEKDDFRLSVSVGYDF